MYGVFLCKFLQLFLLPFLCNYLQLYCITVLLIDCCLVGAVLYGLLPRCEEGLVGEGLVNGRIRECVFLRIWTDFYFFDRANKAMK